MCLSLSVIAASGQFASGVSLVEVYATVLDARGEPVSGLPADAFKVEEDGEPQVVETFAAGSLPLALAIAVDRSFSMPAGRLTQATSAVQRLLGELRPDDRVTLLAIGSGVDILTPLSNDHRAAYDALLALTPWGTTPLHDAVVSAVDAIQPGAGRRALLLISDGVDRYSETDAAAMMAHVRSRDVQVYPIALGATQPPIFVELAALTGGRSFGVRDISKLSQTLTGIARELRHQYLLGYVPRRSASVTPGWRAISVRVDRPGLRVRARDGYVSR